MKIENLIIKNLIKTKSNENEVYNPIVSYKFNFIVYITFFSLI